MLIAQGLQKDFPGEVTAHVIRGVDLQIDKGEFALISGRSGSGKSTLLYLLSGLEKPTQGTVMFHGRALDRLSDRELSAVRRRDFGFVFQCYNLIDVLTVRENILYPLQIDRKITQDDRDHLKELLTLIDLVDHADHFPHQLSGGQQQRVAIARALIARPAIVFADEPTGNLDSENAHAVLTLLQRVVAEQATTLVMVSHDETHRSLATRTIELADGRVAADSAAMRAPV